MKREQEAKLSGVKNLSPSLFLASGRNSEQYSVRLATCSACEDTQRESRKRSQGSEWREKCNILVVLWRQGVRLACCRQGAGQRVATTGEWVFCISISQVLVRRACPSLPPESTSSPPLPPLKEKMVARKRGAAFFPSLCRL